MSAPNPESEPAHDPEVLQLAAKVFDLARHGDTDTLAAYVDAGVPANLTNDKGDSLLVLAAYNGGANAVNRAIRLSGSHNFWVLQGFLPAESRVHVKKFIATLYFFEGQTSVTNFCCVPA